MSKITNITGQRFNRLTAIRISEDQNKGRHTKWECICECGNVVVVSGAMLRTGNTKSCGCISIRRFPIPEKGKSYIYTLACPIDGVVVYVGCTKNMTQRYNGHISETRGNCPIRKWNREIRRKGLKPIMELLEICESSESSFWESFWISQFQVWGFDLKNQMDGVYGSRSFSLSVRKALSKSLTGKKLSLQAIEKLGKKVCQYDINGVYIQTYISENEALRSCKIKSGIRSAIIRGRTAGGFRWKYWSDDYANTLQPYTPYIVNNINAAKARLNPIVEIDSVGNIIGEYSSIKDAQSHLSLNNISAVCRGKRMHTNGRYFKYKKDILTQ